MSSSDPWSCGSRRRRDERGIVRRRPEDRPRCAPRVTCRALQLSESWFYKWRDRPPTRRQARRVSLDAAVRRSFEVSGGRYGSPRVLADLLEAGWRVSKKTVEASMSRQGLVARPLPRRRRCLTRPDKAAPAVPDLVKRDFSAPAINTKWCGDLTEIPTNEGKLYLATVEDLASRRIIGFGVSEHHDAELATAAIKMAVAVRGGDVAGTIFHTDRGSEYNADLFAAACSRSRISQSMGRAGSCFERRGGVVLLHRRVGVVAPHTIGHQVGRPPRGRLVHRLVQPGAPTQLMRDEVTNRLRGDPRRQSRRNRRRRGGGVETGLQDRLSGPQPDPAAPDTGR